MGGRIWIRWKNDPDMARGNILGKYAANVITGIRILCSIGLLFCTVFSVLFYILYLICGITDMIDGTVARKTKSASSFGAKLDSAADLIFVTAAFVKLLPVISFPKWIWYGILIIAVLKTGNIVLSVIRRKKVLFEHTILNKITGFLLFLFPLTLSFLEVKYSAPVVCILAAVSAIQEGYSAHAAL